MFRSSGNRHAGQRALAVLGALTMLVAANFPIAGSRAAEAGHRAVTATVENTDIQAAQEATAAGQVGIHFTPVEGRPRPHDRNVAPTVRPPLPVSPPSLPPPPPPQFYYPGDLTDNGGPVLTSAVMHNIYVNCATPQTCWGNVTQFETDYSLGTLSHVTDQYVDTIADNRYPAGSPDIYVTYAVKNKTLKTSDLMAILSAAIKKGLGTGYGHMYHIFVPQKVDVCDGATDCYSPDNPHNFTFCAYHSYTNISGQHVIWSVEPYQNVPGCAVTLGPNPLTDSTASVLSHEMTEAITDPDISAWYNTTNLDLDHYEIGDECQAANFSTYPTIVLNGDSYKIQLEYSNSYHGCAAVP